MENEKITVKKRIDGYVYRHLQVNETNYLYLLVALAAGAAAGAFVVGCMDSSLKSEIAVIFENYQAALGGGQAVAVGNVIHDNILPIIKQFLVIAVCGTTCFALAAGVIMTSMKGFAVGFFVAAAFCCLPGKEALRLLLPALPYQLLSTAILLAASGLCCAHRKMNEKGYVYYLLMLLLLLLSAGNVLLDVFVKIL